MKVYYYHHVGIFDRKSLLTTEKCVTIVRRNLKALLLHIIIIK